MGTYKNSEKEIIESIAIALDNIEGDFTRKDLNKALEKCKDYPYVCDESLIKLSRKEEKWNKIIGGI